MSQCRRKLLVPTPKFGNLANSYTRILVQSTIGNAYALLWIRDPHLLMLALDKVYSTRSQHRNSQSRAHTCSVKVIRRIIMQVLASVRNWEVPRLFSPLNFRTVRTTAHGAPVYRRSIDPVCASGFRTAGALSLSFDSTKAFRPHRSGKHVVHFQDKDGREQQALARQDRPAEAAEERYTHSGPLVMAWDDSQHTHRAVEWVVKNFASTGEPRSECWSLHCITCMALYIIQLPLAG